MDIKKIGGDTIKVIVWKEKEKIIERTYNVEKLLSIMVIEQEEITKETIQDMAKEITKWYVKEEEIDKDESYIIETEYIETEKS